MMRITAYLILLLLAPGIELAAYDVKITDDKKEIVWAEPAATFHVNLSGMPEGAKDAIISAMKTWNDVSGSAFVFSYGGASNSTAHGEQDSINLIDMGDFDDSTSVINGHYWYSSSTGNMLDYDIRLNQAYLFATDGNDNAYDIQNAITRMLGTAIGLRYLSDDADSDKSMYSKIEKGETKKRTLDMDDKNGLAYLYPAAGWQSRFSVYRFFNTQTETHFFTMDYDERNTVITNYPWFNYEGRAWFAYSPDNYPPDTRPIYRFYNTETGSHFFTIDENEKNTIINNYKWYRYENIAYYAYPAMDGYPAEASPVHRFFNTQTGAHFFTIDSDEAATIIDNYAWYRYEGISWYAFEHLSGEMAWHFTDLINDGIDAKFRLYTNPRGWYWSGRSTEGYNIVKSYSIYCNPGDWICYGAESGNWEWGAGYDGDDDCVDCCYQCLGVTNQIELNMSSARPIPSPTPTPTPSTGPTPTPAPTPPPDFGDEHDEK